MRARCELCGGHGHVPNGIHCQGAPAPPERKPVFAPPAASGLDVLQGTDARIASALRDVLLARAARAREDVCTFFEFVMRTETDQKPVKITPHQRLVFEFMQAHDRVVLILPIEHSKTFCLVAYSLWLIGRNPNLRGVFLSATQDQARKALIQIRDYIEGSAELRLVFPHLRPSVRDGDPWTQNAITVDRPRGTKDPTLQAIGIDSGRVMGSRLSWVVADDTLNIENTNTEEQRNHVRNFVDNACLSRLIYTPETKAIVANSPWHTQDLVGQLDEEGWASLRMSVDGEIRIKDDKQRMLLAKQFEMPWKPFDSDLVRPSTPDPSDETVRLVAHDPDPGNRTPLWPESFPHERIEELRLTKLPHDFNRLYRCIVRDDDTARCKLEYIDKCLLIARKLGITQMVHEYRGQNPTFTGVDLAIDEGESHDDTAFFTFESRPDGLRVILDFERGQWPGPVIMKKLFEKQKAFNSVVRVESNAAQMYIRQFALEKDKSLPIKAHMTGRAKAHAEHGVEGFFLELSNGAWAIPNDGRGDMHPMIRKLVNACLNYVPTRHTDDGLMACYMARAQAREWGMGPKRSDPTSGGGGIGANILAR